MLHFDLILLEAQAATQILDASTLVASTTNTAVSNEETGGFVQEKSHPEEVNRGGLWCRV